jgi:hypothetical protein
MLKKIILYLFILTAIPLGIYLQISCKDETDENPPGNLPNGKVIVSMAGQGLQCIEPNAPANTWKMDIFVDNLAGPFWSTPSSLTFTGSNNNTTNFDIFVPTTGMYTITVEIYPSSSTNCSSCCAATCSPDPTGKPEFRGLQTFNAVTSSHTVSVNLEDCDCC